MNIGLMFPVFFSGKRYLGYSTHVETELKPTSPIEELLWTEEGREKLAKAMTDIYRDRE